LTSLLTEALKNNNPIYKAPKALASEALATGESWVLIKSFTVKVGLKPTFKYRQWVNADYCLRQRVPDSWRRTAKGSSRKVCTCTIIISARWYPMGFVLGRFSLFVCHIVSYN